MKIFLCVALSCVFISSAQADVVQTIKVAVVEGTPVTEADKDKSLIKTNVDRYLGMVQDKTIDIIVLPEYGLTGRTDDKSLAINLSNSTDEDLKYVNEQAKKKNAIIVASFLEKDGDDLYSSTVALDGTDVVVAKYRKTNLNEAEKNLKTENKVVSFKHPSSGVTIGLLSGDDILYDQPARKLVKEDNATIIIYTSSMVSVAPFSTTVSLQAGFAKAHGVNLLVASLHDPTTGTSGSGIYKPCEVNAFISANKGDNKVVTDYIDVKPNVDCKPSTDDVLLFNTRLHGTDVPLANLPKYNYSDFTTEILNETNYGNKEVCHGKFCCDFNVTLKTNKTETYMFVVGGNQRVCGIMECINNTIESCGRIGNTTTSVFSKLAIGTTDSDDLFVPYVLHSDLTPGKNLNGLTFKEDDTSANFSITADLTDVIAVGIVAAKSGASSLQILTTFIFALSFLLKQF